MTKTESEFVRCPKCHSKNWEDIPNTEDSDKTRFRCNRCQYPIRMGICSKCGIKNWQLIKGIEKKGGHKPYYRFKCRSCDRTVGFLLGL